MYKHVCVSAIDNVFCTSMTTCAFMLPGCVLCGEILYLVMITQFNLQHCMLYIYCIGTIHFLDSMGTPYIANDTTSGPDIKSRYITAMYFTMTTLTSIGFGNVAPNTKYEKVFSIVAMMIGGERKTFFLCYNNATYSCCKAKNSRFRLKL